MNQVSENTDAVAELQKMSGKSGSLFKRFDGGPRDRVRQDRQAIEEKWMGPGGTKMAYPSACGVIETEIASAIKVAANGKVCEIGCGTGRVAKLFKPHRYLGVDINPGSIGVAERQNPNHKFDLIMWDTLYPGADTYLFYTVLMHIPDNELAGIVRRLDNRVIIAESMGRWLRDYGRGNNYHRDPDEYRTMFKRFGFKEISLSHCLAFHYPFYLDVMVFESV